MVKNTSKHKVVVIGGGFGGLACVQELKNANLNITLIDQRNHHLFQPLLYQVATTILPTSEVAWPLRSIVRDRKDVTTLLARVVGVDPENKNLKLDSGEPIPYDTLVLATGARHAYFGNDHWEKHAPGLKTIEDATTIRRKILLAFENAERATSEEERKAWQTFVVIGAGPTGVELAGIIAELAHRVLPKDFRRIDTRQSRILLVEAGPRVLAAFPEKLSEYTKNVLTKSGVEVRTGHPVTHCDNDHIVLEDNKITTHTTIWAAGVQASPAGKWLNAETDRAGRVKVNPDLTVSNHHDIFVIGDTASLADEQGNQIPGIAPAAKQQGAYVGKCIKNRLAKDKSMQPFKYKHSGNLATIGPGAAVIDLGWLQMKGFVAWWIWGITHVYFLITNRSRFSVATGWVWSYLTGQKSARLITQGKQESKR